MDKFFGLALDLAASNPVGFVMLVLTIALSVVVLALIVVPPCVEVWDAMKRKVTVTRMSRQRKKARQPGKCRNPQ